MGGPTRRRISRQHSSRGSLGSPSVGTWTEVGSISAALSVLPRLGEERGLISRTAAGNRVDGFGKKEVDRGVDLENTYL